VKNFFIKAPRSCSNCIDYVVSNVQCYDNGTADPADDYYTLVLLFMDLMITGLQVLLSIKVDLMVYQRQFG
jgi:hypothetical protein